MNLRILVTGATGNVGSAVLEALAGGSHEVAAAVRNPEAAGKRWGSRFQYAAFDFARPETFPPALRGIDRLFLMRPPELGQLQGGLDRLLAAAREAGVRQVVYLSVMGANAIPGNPHRSIERRIRASGLPCTFLRAGFFMQNLHLHHARLVREQGELCIPAGRGRTSFIDTRDIGAVAARILTESGHEGQAYTLTGNAAPDFHQVAAVMSEVLGRSVRYTNPSPPAFRRAMIAQGYPADFANFMIILYLMTRLGLAAKITPETERLLGRPPRTVREYLIDHAAQFQ